MKQSLIKLVDVILRKIQEDSDKPISENGLRNWLLNEGYQKRDIEAAINLLRPRFDTLQPANEEAPLAMRTFSSFEAFKLAPEARDAIVRLEQYGLIDGYEREMILDRLNHFEGEIGLEELDYLVSWVVCGSRDVESQQTIYNVLDGTKQTLH